MVCEKVCHAASDTKVAPADAAHVISRMAVHSVDRKTQFTGRLEDRFIPLPITAPFLYVMDPVEKLLFGNFPGHPTGEHFLISSKDRFNSDGNIGFAGLQFPEKFRSIGLATRKRVIIADPN